MRGETQREVGGEGAFSHPAFAGADGEDFGDIADALFCGEPALESGDVGFVGEAGGGGRAEAWEAERVLVEERGRARKEAGGGGAHS